MIETFYENPNKPKPAIYQVGTSFTQTEHTRAISRGLTPAEYRRRVAIVTKAWVACKLNPGDVGFPVPTKDFAQYGKCVVRAVCRHFDDYGDVPWNEEPFILQVSPVDRPNEFINATGNYLNKLNEVLTLDQNEC